MRSSSFFSRAALAILPLTQGFLAVAARHIAAEKIIAADLEPELYTATTTAPDLVVRQATVTPTATWTPAPVCANGGQVVANAGGTYVDAYGNRWDTRCGMTLSGATFLDLGTNGQGYYACVKSCARRPLCTAFYFVPSGTGQTGPKAGSGRCYWLSAAGTYSVDAAKYAAVHLISSGTGANALPVSLETHLYLGCSMLTCFA